MKMRVLTSVAAAAVLAASLSACQQRAEEANTGNTADAAATAPVDTTNTAVPPADAGNMTATGNMTDAGNMTAGNMTDAGNATTGNTTP